jgi:C4-dicarboxylate transporter DctM subunit
MLAVGLTSVVTATLLTGSMLGIGIAAFGLVILYFQFGGNFSVLGNALWNTFNSFTFTAIPAFILLGELLGRSGLADRIYTAISPIFERLPGRLLQTNIGSCTAFAAISGSSTATSAVIGSIAYEELLKRGYERGAVLGTIAAGGTLGILIPPSIAFIIYGSWQNVSIGALFIAGIIPGLLLSLLFMFYIGVRATLNPSIAPSSGTRPSLGQSLIRSIEAWPFAILIFAILGSIFFGFATPTESAALGVLTTLILAAFYRRLSRDLIWQSLVATVRTFSSLSLVIAGAVVLSQAVALTGLPKELIRLVGEAGLSPSVVILAIYVMYIVLGCFFGPIEMLLITLPFVFPLVTGLGYDPIWFGVVLVIVIEIGLLTPPVGINLFVVMAISRNQVGLGEVAMACVPYWMIMVGVLLLLTFLPQIVLFLPQIAGFS